MTLATGQELRLVFKQLDWALLDDEARLAKPRLPPRPAARAGGLRARCSTAAPASEPPALLRRAARTEARPALALRRVGRGPRALPGRRARALGGGRALAGAMHHAGFAARARCASRREVPLLDYDAAYYRRWIERARDFAGADRERARERCRWLGERYDAVVEELLVAAADRHPRRVLRLQRPRRPASCRLRRVAVRSTGSWRRTAPAWSTSPRLISGDWSDGPRGPIVAAYAATAGGGLLLGGGSSTSPASTSRSSGSAGRRRAGSRPRGSGTTGSARRSQLAERLEL